MKHGYYHKNKIFLIYSFYITYYITYLAFSRAKIK